MRQAQRMAAARVIAVGLILLLAGFLRTWRLDGSSFTYDAAAAGNLAVQAVDLGRWPAHGMTSSVGVDNPPLFIYLLALPVALTRNPITLMALMALCNTLGVWGCYRLGRRYWSTSIGLAAALLFAVSPWAVDHSRALQAQDLLPAGCVLFFSLLYAWLIDRRPWALAGVLITLAALIQIHLAALALLPVLAVLMGLRFVGLLRHRAPRTGRVHTWAALLTGLAGGLMLYVPYLFEDLRTGAPNLARILAMLNAPARVNLDLFQNALLNIGGREIHSLAGPQQFQRFLAALPRLDYWPDRIEETLVVVAVLFLLLRLWSLRAQPRRMTADALLLLWLGVPLLFFYRSKSEAYLHYLNVLYPAQYLALAVAGGAWLSWAAPRLPGRRLVHGVAVAALLSLAAWQAYLSTSIYAFLDVHDTPGGRSTPVRILLEVTDTLQRYVAGSPSRQVVVLCAGQDPRFDDCPAVFQFLTSRFARPRFVDYRQPLTWAHTAGQDMLVLLDPSAPEAIAEELARLAQPLAGESVPLRAGAGDYRFYRLRDDQRTASAVLEGLRSDGDAVVLDGAGLDGLAASLAATAWPVYRLPGAGANRGQTQAQIAALAGRYQRVYAVYRVSEESDPEGLVDAALSALAFRSADHWLGSMRMVTYLMATPGATPAAHAAGLDLGDQLRLAAYALPAAPAAAGELLPLRLDWQVIDRPAADYSLFVQLLDSEGRLQAQRDAPLQASGRPSGSWEPGLATSTQVGLLIPGGQLPGAYRLIAGLYNPATGQRLNTGTADHLELGTIHVRVPKRPLSPAHCSAPYDQVVVYPDLSLVGHDLYPPAGEAASAPVLRRGSTLPLVLCWQAGPRAPAASQFTARLVDRRGHALAQITGQPAGDAYPTSAWQPGQLLQARHDFPLPAGLAPGRYFVQLAVHPAGQDAPGPWTTLGPVDVQ